MSAAEMLQDIDKEGAETISLYANLIDEAVKGYFPGTRDIRGDAEFRAWFLTMLKDYGPDWVVALDFAEGGRAVLERWNRITGVQSGAYR
jgi:hypothetical protein